MLRQRTRMRLGTGVLLMALAATGCGGTEEAEGGQIDDGSAGGAAAGSDGEGASRIVAGDLDAVCEAAKEEGSLVFWESEELETLKKMFAEFSETYPGIELEPVELRPEEIAQRMITSAAAGRAIGADVFQGNLDAFTSVIDRDLVDTSIDWEALGVRSELITDTNMVRSSRIANGLVYNTNVLSPEELPNTWEELIDDRWRGQVVVDPRANPLQSLVLPWGQERLMDYITRMKETVQPVPIKGGTAGMLTVASEENLLTTNGRSAETLEQQAQGSPIEIHYLDIIPTSDFYEGVPVDAPHPNAAACWVAWKTGPDGSAASLEYAFKHNDDIPPGAPEGATIVPIETTEDVEAAAEAAAMISEVWAGLG